VREEPTTEEKKGKNIVQIGKGKGLQEQQISLFQKKGETILGGEGKQRLLPPAGGENA